MFLQYAIYLTTVNFLFLLELIFGQFKFGLIKLENFVESLQEENQSILSCSDTA